MRCRSLLTQARSGVPGQNLSERFLKLAVSNPHSSVDGSAANRR